MRDLPHEPTVTVLGAVDLQRVARPARLIHVERPDGSSERRVQIAGGDGFPDGDSL